MAAQQPTSVRLTPAQTNRLQALAVHLGVPVGVLIRLAVQHYLESHA
jgi:predicted DNA-binding protein